MVSVCHQIGGLVGLQGSGDGALRSARHQVGGLVWPARFRDGVLRSTRHQVGGLVWPARFRDGVLRSTRHQIGGLVGLQGCGMVLYDLPAIRSVAWCGCKVVGDRVPLSNSLFCHF